MKALVYTGTEKLEYKDFKDPNLKNDESIIKVEASGICGSDMHAYHGKDERRIPPLILGHEVSGVIVNGDEKDKKVVLNPLITCGECEFCNSGSEHLCSKRVLLGMNRPVERQGGFAEMVLVPNKNIYELPKGLDMKKAPIAEPTAVSLHAVELGQKNLKKSFKNFLGTYIIDECTDYYNFKIFSLRYFNKTEKTLQSRRCWRNKVLRSKQEKMDRTGQNMTEHDRTGYKTKIKTQKKDGKV